MTILDSFILAAVGLLVVIGALSIIAIFILIMGRIVNSKKAAPAVTTAPAPAKVAAPAPVVQSNAGKVAIPVTTSAGSVDLHNVSDRDAAIIMAIVAEQLKEPLNTLAFKSIKEV